MVVFSTSIFDLSQRMDVDGYRSGDGGSLRVVALHGFTERNGYQEGTGNNHAVGGVGRGVVKSQLR